MEYTSLDSSVVSTAIALGIGLLIGAERERSKGSGPTREIAGVRTFALASLVGAFSRVLGDVLVGVFALAIAAITIVGYLRTRNTDPGITTEIALLATFVLGALSLSHPAYSAGAAVAVTVLLASRSWLHDLVTSRLSEREMHDGLLLAAAGLVILPLLPDRPIDPWQMLNPRKMWIVVVLVMAISAAGYVGLRLWGSRTGLLVAGLLGGLVSSVSTHGAMGQRAKEHPTILANAAAAATLSSVTTAVFLLGVVTAINTQLALSLAPACVAAALASATSAWLLYRRSAGTQYENISLGRPISLQAALTFGAVLSSVLVISTLLTKAFGSSAALASVTAAGFADAHSGAVSAAMLQRGDILSPPLAQIAVLLSYTANATTKVIVSAVAGPRPYLWRIAAGTFAAAASAWIAWLVTVKVTDW
jgi:uncharacterized membrane protein (DUF4010 family)